MSSTPTDVVARIAALCRKAESTDSPHEAQALMEGAQHLATLAAIDLEVARRYRPAHERPRVLVVETVDIGPARKVGLRTYVRLFLAVARPNDVRVTVAGDNTKVFAHGYDMDVAVLRCLYPSILVQMVAASDMYLRGGTWRDGTYTDRRGVRRMVGARQARISFQESYAETIELRLFAARAATIHTVDSVDIEALVGAASTGSSAGADPNSPSARLDIGLAQASPGGGVQGRAQLALVDKSAEVERFFRSRVSTRAMWREAAAVSRAAVRAGGAAAHKAVLSPQRALGGSKGAIGAG